MVKIHNIIKLINNDCTRISKDLKDSWYINDRLPKRGKFINKANTRIGNHSLRNRLQDLNSLTFDWIGIYSDEYLRKNLKKTFFLIWSCDKITIRVNLDAIFYSIYLLISHLVDQFVNQSSNHDQSVTWRLVLMGRLLKSSDV